MEEKYMELIWQAQELSRENPKSSTLKETEKLILELNDPEASYQYAATVRGADKKAHAKVVLESKDLRMNTCFAMGGGKRGRC